MTEIQLRYWQNKENERHNREMERLTGENQAEAARANRAKEKLSWYSARNEADFQREQKQLSASARALNYANYYLTTAKTNSEKVNTGLIAARTASEQANAGLTTQKTQTEKANTTISQVDADYAKWEKDTQAASTVGNWIVKGGKWLSNIFE